MRKLIPLFLLGALCSAGMASLPEGYGILYLNRHASPEVREAASGLAGLMERQFGAAPEIRSLPLWGGNKGIRIGPAPRHEGFGQNPLVDEILIERTANSLAIHGSDNMSTCFAIYRFAEKFLGWRYYQPGELGLERINEPLALPASRGPGEILLHEKADFFSRNIYPIGRDHEGIDWALWNGLRERFYYNHTLHRVLPPTKFDDKPEWFAKNENSKPMRPPYYPKVHGYNDHPDLSIPAVREWVVEKTLDAIKASKETETPGTGGIIYPPVRSSPGMLSVSISLGDSFVFGHFGEEYPWKPNEYFRRWPDWSNHVFDYSNSVAQGIEAGMQQMEWAGGQQPDLYIGTLAYLNWEEVPDFEIHPSIVPYLTFDRSQWYDEGARADDLQNVEAWNRTAAPFLGTWDYLFGYGFIIPRSMAGIVSDSIPALYERGVRAYFSQVAPIWPYDGHTNWLLSRLLWNADADADALLDEYFREFYGPAAGSMRGFFDHAEAIWMAQKSAGWWLRHWKDPWQAGLWTEEDLKHGENLLRAAEAAAANGPTTAEGLDPERFLKRIGHTRRMFEFTTAFHEYQMLCWQLQAGKWESENLLTISEGIQLSGEAVEARQRMVEARNTALRATPLARRASDLQWVFRYDSLGASMANLLFAMNKRKMEDSVYAAELSQLLHRWAGTQGLQFDPESEIAWSEVLNDRTYSHIGNPKIWHRQFMDSEGMHQGARSDGQGFIARNVRRGHIYQLFAAHPGDFYLGEVMVETQQSLTGEVYIRIDFFNEGHELIAESKRARIAPAETAGQRQKIRALMQAPDGAAYGRLFIRFYEMDPGSEAALDSASVLRMNFRAP